MFPKSVDRIYCKFKESAIYYLGPNLESTLSICIFDRTLSGSSQNVSQVLSPTSWDQHTKHISNSNKSLIPASWKNFTSTFDAYLKGNQSAASESFFFLFFFIHV